MSDLAPFVAATLRDRALTEVQEALQREKQANVDFKSVQLYHSNDNNNNNDGDAGVVVLAKGLIPEGMYDDQRGEGFGSLLWKMDLQQQQQNALPPTLEAILNLKVSMGGGWINEERIFGSRTDPFVVPVRFEASTRTGRFELPTFSNSSRVKKVVLAIHPIENVAQYNLVVGPPPGGLYSRLVQWVEQQAAEDKNVSVSFESVSLEVQPMKAVLRTLHVPLPPARGHRFNQAQREANRVVQRAQMEAMNTQVRAQAAAALAQGNAQLVRLQRLVGEAARGHADEEEEEG